MAMSLLPNMSIGCVSLFIQDVSFPPFSTMVFVLTVVDFDLFLLLEDKLFQSSDSGTIS